MAAAVTDFFPQISQKKAENDKNGRCALKLYLKKLNT